jgi:hypothetical protein
VCVYTLERYMLCYHLCNSCFVPATNRHHGCVHNWKDWICEACVTHIFKLLWQALLKWLSSGLLHCLTTLAWSTVSSSLSLKHSPEPNWVTLQMEAARPSKMLQQSHYPPHMSTNTLLLSPKLQNLVKMTTGHVSMSQKMQNVPSMWCIQVLRSPNFFLGNGSK